MSKSSSTGNSARRTAEALLSKAQKRETSFKLEQEREREAMTLKIARLRELRIAKEEAEKDGQPGVSAAPSRAAKPRRSRQT